MTSSLCFRKWFLILYCATVLSAQTTLRQAGARRALLMGAAAAADEFGNPNPLVLEPLYASTLGTQYSMLEPENAMKWSPIHPAQNTYNFQPGDVLVAFAQAHQMQVRGHNLCWESYNPDWVKTLAATATPATMSAVLQDHINTVVTLYKGQVFAWDVVNEAVSDTQTGTGTVMKDSIWYNQPGIGLTGTGYVEQAFRWAHAVDPKALLFYNDYNIEDSGRKFNAIYAMMKDFVTRGVPISGVGIQMHIPETGYPTSAGLAQNIRQLTALGLQVHITEMDVRIPMDSNGNGPAAGLQTQAQTYRRVLTICLQNPGCTAFQTWGFTDKHSWIPGFYPGFGAALPFDVNYQPKPAFNSMLSALQTVPLVLNSTGIVNAASYKGGAVAPGELLTILQDRVSSVTKAPGEMVTLDISVDSQPGRAPVALQWEVVFPAQLMEMEGDAPEIGSAAMDSGKSLQCTARKPYSYVCILSGGQNPIANGPIASFHFRIRTTAEAAKTALRIERVVATTLDSKVLTLNNTESIVIIR
jgi:endo-1,4-beta-xylanase